MNKDINKNKLISASICGASGYTGIELLRILASHPNVKVTAATSEKSAGKNVFEIFPHLHAYKDLAFEPLNKKKLLDKADIFFLALPHGASQETVDFFFKHGKTVIDLSADYRLVSPAIYKQWYGLAHSFTPTLKQAVYGMPEIYRNKIMKARLIANPGCYPTSAILGLMPAVLNKLIDTSSIIIDSKSGTSGAGRKADLAVSYCEVNEGFMAYGLATHRHTPEIEQELSLLAGNKIKVDFTPHLLPVDRGILTTMYAPIKKNVSEDNLFDIYSNAYKKEPFVTVLGKNTYPNIKYVRGTNFCHIGLKINERTNTLIVITAIDNLVKGASGQAVQNMNIMSGFNETTGLESLALIP